MKKLNEKEILKTPVFTVVEKIFEGVNFHPVGLNCNDWVMVIVYDKKADLISHAMGLIAFLSLELEV